MKQYEASAKTVEEAIELGLQELGVSIGDVDVRVVEEGSKGLFGLFGSREEAEQCPERYRRYMEAAGIPGLPGDVFVTETVDTGHSTTMED